MSYKTEETQLHYAAWHRNADDVRRLLNEGVDVNEIDEKGETALMAAALVGSAECVRALLEGSAQVNLRDKDGDTALINASSIGILDSVRVLLEMGADVNINDNDGYSALMEASKKGNVDCVRVLLAKGAKINAQDKDGYTALIDASYMGMVDCVRLLLEQGAQANICDKEGLTSLMWASSGQKVECMRVLLEYGAQMNIQDKNGRTPLMEVALQGNVEGVILLLEKGADVNIQDKKGNTALHDAASESHLECVKVLLAIPGIEVNVQNSDQDTPLTLAKDEEILTMIKEAIARAIEMEKKAEKPEMETKKLYDEAIEKGYVEYCTITCLIHGLAGVGKTHVKQLLLNKPPPIQRTSTGLADNAVRAVTVSALGVSNKDEDEWRILDGDDDLMRAISKMISGYVEPIPKPDHHSKQPRGQMSSPVSGGRSAGLSSDVSTSNTVPGLPTKQAPDKDEVQPIIKIITDGELGKAPSELDQTDADITESHMSVEERIIGLIKKHSGNKEHLKLKWIQLIDSGGQPQFHHILPLFVRNLSVVMFVLKLSEELDHKPQVLYYESGKVVGKAYQSPFSHREVLERCFKAVHSSPSRPVVIVIGTHKDLKQACNETMKVKNETIVTCLKTNNISPIYTGETMEEVIFAVNSQAPQAEDKDYAKYLRHQISKLTSEVKKMPIAWFCLEVSVHVLTQKKRRKILSLSECKQTAECFQIKDKAFIAALKYFVDCNILLYYCEVLPNIVFCNPQVLLSIITELVQYCYKLRENPDPNKPISGEWQRFKDYAYITEKQLDSFHGHYHKGVFSSHDLLKLFISHSIVAPVGKEEYLMPALLPALPHGNIPSVQLSGDPLLIRLKKGCFPGGVFCSLVAQLLNDACCNLSLCIKDNKPKCLYSNAVTFKCYNHPATVTIVDGNSHFAIYIHAELKCEPPHSSIRTCVHRGTISACTQFGYQCKQEDITYAVYCSHDDCKGQEKHLADISATKTDSWTTCCHDGSRIMLLVDSQKLWFSAERSTNVSTSRVPSACSLPLSVLVDQAAQTLGGPPTLISLKTIKPDLAIQVGANYYNFCIHLLEDATGAKVQALEVEHSRCAERINNAILTQWIQGKGCMPVSWPTLINVLQRIGM